MREPRLVAFCSSVTLCFQILHETPGESQGHQEKQWSQNHQDNLLAEEEQLRTSSQESQGDAADADQRAAYTGPEESLGSFAVLLGEDWPQEDHETSHAMEQRHGEFFKLHTTDAGSGNGQEAN